MERSEEAAPVSGSAAIETQAAPPRSAAIAKAFSGLKFERGEGGKLKIEAEGESAAILAGVFKGMADLFGSIAH